MMGKPMLVFVVAAMAYCAAVVQFWIIASTPGSPILIAMGSAAFALGAAVLGCMVWERRGG